MQLAGHEASEVWSCTGVAMNSPNDLRKGGHPPNGDRPSIAIAMLARWARDRAARWGEIAASRQVRSVQRHRAHHGNGSVGSILRYGAVHVLRDFPRMQEAAPVNCASSASAATAIKYFLLPVMAVGGRLIAIAKLNRIDGE
jgi:hypothetical protein